MSDVAEFPAKGDVVVMRGGYVNYKVHVSFNDRIHAVRAEVRRGVDPLVNMQVMDVLTWRDLISFGASSVSSSDEVSQ